MSCENFKNLTPLSYDETDPAKPPLKHFQRDELVYQRFITRGGMGEISLYRLRTDGYPYDVAVKELFRRSVSDREKERLEKEMEILGSLDHENIITIYGIADTYSGFGLVLEFLPNGSYKDFFDKVWHTVEKTVENETKIVPFKIRLLGEVVEAMNYLHGIRPKRILHLDLKCENVLLDSNLHAKICDFGLSRMSTLTSIRNSMTLHGGGVSGTPGCIAPERFRDIQSKPTVKCDVYSFGILTFTVLTDSLPFSIEAYNNLRLFEYNISEKNVRPDIRKIPTIYPEKLMEMMKASWCSDPKDRPTFQKLKQDFDSIKVQNSYFYSDAEVSVKELFTWLREKSLPMRRENYQNQPVANDQFPLSRPRHQLFESCSTIDPPERRSNNHKTSISTGYASGSSSQEQVTALKVLASEIITINNPPDQNSAAIKGSVSTRPLPRQLSKSLSNSTRLPFATTSFQTRSYEEAKGKCENETECLIPKDKPRRVRERSACLWDGVVVLATVVTIFGISGAIAYFLSNGSTKNQASVGYLCTDLKLPSHGGMICQNDTSGHYKNCSFYCDKGYRIIGNKTTICSGGRWSSKEPSCEKVGTCTVLKRPLHGSVICESEIPKTNTTCTYTCDKGHRMIGDNRTICFGEQWTKKKPVCTTACLSLSPVPNSDVNCTNGNFENSNCTFTCNNRHEIQGVETLACKNSTWSHDLPSCVCPKCSVGDNCELSNKIGLVIESARDNTEVVYGGHTIRCTTTRSWHDWEVVWKGTCTDIATGLSAKCPRCEHTDIHSPKTASHDAAKELIRNMVERGDYPYPCDPENMKTT